jgi:hypothetical protein
MSEQEARSVNGRRVGVIVGITAIGLATAGWVGWSVTCPCDRTPGGFLFGSVAAEPVSDWSFANDVPLCQIQVGRIPYSINLNCMATPSGELYLSCSGCSGKNWSGVVMENSNVRLRLDGTVYPVTATRVVDSAELDRAWRARVDKLQRHADPPLNPPPPPDAQRPDHWWSFRLESRSGPG